MPFERDWTRSSECHSYHRRNEHLRSTLQMGPRLCRRGNTALLELVRLEGDKNGFASGCAIRNDPVWQRTLFAL
jgi:hypothetical protein